MQKSCADFDANSKILWTETNLIYSFFIENIGKYF